MALSSTATDCRWGFVSQRHFQHFFTLVAANGLLGHAIALFLPLYFQRLGLSGLQTGIYFAFTSAAAVLLALPVGISTDRVTIVRILIVGDEVALNHG